MPGFAQAIIAGVTAFAATNIDDIVVLMLFFAQTQRLRAKEIFIGQYLGFGVLLLASLPGFLGGAFLPRPVIGLLGFLPIVIGISQLFHQESDEQTVQTVPEEWSSEPTSGRFPRRQLARLLNPKIYQVALVTIANGGDNIGIYVPLFANSTLTDLGIILVTFLVMIAVWCAIARYLARHPMFAEMLTRYGHRVVPFVLIGLGIYILLESETYKLLGNVK